LLGFKTSVTEALIKKAEDIISKHGNPSLELKSEESATRGCKACRPQNDMER